MSERDMCIDTTGLNTTPIGISSLAALGKDELICMITCFGELSRQSAMTIEYTIDHYSDMINPVMHNGVPYTQIIDIYVTITTHGIVIKAPVIGRFRPLRAGIEPRFGVHNSNHAATVGIDGYARENIIKIIKSIDGWEFYEWLMRM